MSELRDELVRLEVESSERVFDGVVWDVRRDTFELEGTRLTREVVDHPGAVAVLALDDDGRAVLIQQYRHPVAAKEWELPAGLLDVEGEDPLRAAQRELAEEVDLVAEHWSVLVDYFTSPGGLDECIRVYLATGLGEVAQSERHEREGEEAHLVVRRAGLEEIRGAILAGRLHNSTLLVAALTALEYRARDWTDLRPADTPWPEHPANR